MQNPKDGPPDFQSFNNEALMSPCIWLQRHQKASNLEVCYHNHTESIFAQLSGKSILASYTDIVGCCYTLIRWH